MIELSSVSHKRLMGSVSAVVQIAHMKSFQEQPKEAALRLDRAKSTLNNLQSY
jgi:hypothetical protein